MNRDHALIAAALAVVAVIFVPLPAPTVDALIVASFAAAGWMLYRAVIAKEPLEFAGFPSILLVSTAFRLALSIATTRLVLSRAGEDGTLAAGRVIRAFGEFVAGAEPVIGAVLFTIIVVVNFVVISKGATRISEVSARFALDALPGRQSAIDGDLSSGAIDAAEAQRRREKISREADFHGAMDGATKFIRGDAIAAVIITLVNVAGGLVIGVFQHHLSIGEALHTYTLLTIGDGLVMQIPALVVSLAAGVLVTQERRTVAAPVAPVAKTAETVESLLHVDVLEVRVGVGLAALAQGGLTERVAQMRREVAAELGIVVPAVAVRDTASLRATEYEVRLRGEPVKRAPARLNAAALTQIAADLREVVKTHAAELLTRDDVAVLLRALRESHPALVDEVVPALVKPAELQRILQGLLREGVPVRDLAAILESFDGGGVESLTERARAALSRTIARRFAKDGVLAVVTVDPAVEEMVREGRTANVPERIARETDKLVLAGRAPVVLCRPAVRPLMRRLADAARPGIAVLSYAEIPAELRIEPAGSVKAEAEVSRT